MIILVFISFEFMQYFVIKYNYFNNDIKEDNECYNIININRIIS